MTDSFLPVRTNQVPMIEVMIETPPMASGNTRAFAQSARNSDPRNMTATVVTA